jgi:hypothetical protein
MTMKEFRVAGQVSEGEAVRSYITVIRGWKKCSTCSAAASSPVMTIPVMTGRVLRLADGRPARPACEEFGWVLERVPGAWRRTSGEWIGGACRLRDGSHLPRRVDDVEGHPRFS